LERAVAAWTEAEEAGQYVRGDLFCYEDFVLFLIFDDERDGREGVRAGIVYLPSTAEPLKKLEAFCRNVRDAIEAARNLGGERRHESLNWQAAASHGTEGLARFAAARKDEESVGMSLERRLALEVLEDAETRRMLQRLNESESGRRVRELVARNEEKSGEDTINRLFDVGLLKREVLVSCRKQGRALFNLPSQEELKVLTNSNATCSECGVSIGEEKIEEIIAPSESALTLLNDGVWLANHLRGMLRELGVPDRNIAARPASGNGEVTVLANVCQTPFLFFLRDGELTVNHARRALSRLEDAEAEQVVIISTGKMHKAGRVLLREFARRRAARADVEILLVEGLDAAQEELAKAFERVSERALMNELCELDGGLGFSAGYLIAQRFRLMQRPGALAELAESAVAALTTNLEIQ
jgi:RNA polymerase-binding transcription factor DksA